MHHHCCSLRFLHMLPALAEPTSCLQLPQKPPARFIINGLPRSRLAKLQVDRASCKIICTVAPEKSDSSILKQGTAEWHELRQGRLTASLFSAALGFWGNDRRLEVWEEKVGLRAPFAGNSATEWGVSKETTAVQRYREVTGNVVVDLGFKVYKEGDDVQDWLGASPDGLIEGGVSGVYEKGGILEVKCPHNKGRPELCVPWAAAPYYYIPQVQGLMEILDRDWLDLYVWTLNGSAIFRMDRNPEYWALVFGVLSDFWWTNVVPGKQARLLQQNVDVNIYQPNGQHRLTHVVINESRQLASKATLIWKDPVGKIPTDFKF